MKLPDMNRAVFLDKDGTLIPDIPYNVDPDKISLADNCTEGLRMLAAAGYKLIVISNQSGIAKGYFSEAEFLLAMKRLYKLLEAEAVRLDAFYYCPHSPGGTTTDYSINCDCRKPMPGMLLKAARDHQLDLDHCWMIGDILNDVEAGNRAGCKSILVDNGNETEWLEGPYRQPGFSCRNVNEAAAYILNYGSDVGLG